MGRIYVKQVIEELEQIHEIDHTPLHKIFDHETLKNNKLVRKQVDGKWMYFCTNCNTWHENKKVKLKSKLKCPHCNHSFTVIGTHNVIDRISYYITSFEANERGELICRLFFLEKNYNKDTLSFKKRCIEILRINVDRNIRIKNGTYWIPNIGWSHRWDKTWHREKRRNAYGGYYAGTPFSELVPYDIVCTKGLKKTLCKTKYRYSAMNIIANHDIDTIKYLCLWTSFPQIEILAKAKCYKLIRQITDGRIGEDELFSLLKLMKNKRLTKMLLKYDLEYKEFKMAFTYDLDDITQIRKAVKCNMTMDVKHKEALKIIDYLIKQKQRCQEYQDYLRLAYLLGMDISNNKIRYPIDLEKAHDYVSDRYKSVEDLVISNKIEEYSKELNALVYENKQFVIRPAQSQNELFKESRKLNHCVRSYDKRMAKRETAILFIRKRKLLDEPFVTLELNNNKVVQVRGKNNSIPDENVQNFVREWEKQYHLVGY